MALASGSAKSRSSAVALYTADFPDAVPVATTTSAPASAASIPAHWCAYNLPASTPALRSAARVTGDSASSRTRASVRASATRPGRAGISTRAATHRPNPPTFANAAGPSVRCARNPAASRGRTNDTETARTRTGGGGRRNAAGDAGDAAGAPRVGVVGGRAQARGRGARSRSRRRGGGGVRARRRRTRGTRRDRRRGLRVFPVRFPPVRSPVRKSRRGLLRPPGGRSRGLRRVSGSRGNGGPARARAREASSARNAAVRRAANPRPPGPRVAREDPAV